MNSGVDDPQVRPLAWGYAMLMSPNEDETAVLGCHCPGDMALRMRNVLALPCTGLTSELTSELQLAVCASVLILVQCIVRKNCVHNRHLFLNRWKFE